MSILTYSQQISLTAQQQSIGIQQVVSAMNALSQAANRELSTMTVINDLSHIPVEKIDWNAFNS